MRGGGGAEPEPEFDIVLVVAEGRRRFCQVALVQEQEPAEDAPADAHGDGELAGGVLDLAAQRFPDVGQFDAVAELRGGVEDRGGQHPIGAEQVWLAPVVCRQVPDTRLADQAVRVEGVRAHRTVAAVLVAYPHPAAAEGRLLQHVEMTGGLGGAAPAHRVDQDAPAGELRAGALLIWQRCHQLAQRGADRLAETQAQVGAGRSGQQDEQRAGFLGSQAGDVGAVAGRERNTAERAAHRVDRDARRGQGLHIAHDRPHRDFEVAG
jgi:hypothetical protein